MPLRELVDCWLFAGIEVADQVAWSRNVGFLDDGAGRRGSEVDLSIVLFYWER